jgi:hypothetical protein
VPAAAAVLAVSLVGCGDDPNDAPGGSAPAGPAAETVPEATGPAGSGHLSPEAADEAHPSLPTADDPAPSTEP